MIWFLVALAPFVAIAVFLVYESGFLQDRNRRESVLRQADHLLHEAPERAAAHACREADACWRRSDRAGARFWRAVHREIMRRRSGS